MGFRTGLFSSKSFRSQVMAEINKKIDEVEKRIKLEQEMAQETFEKKVSDLKEILKADKEVALKNGMKEILGKII